MFGTNEDGLQIDLGRYGVATLSLMGRYQIANASLAVIAAGNMHGRLRGVHHGSDEYITAIRAGLSDVTWPGRCQKLQDSPLVYLDGAINKESADLLVESVRDNLKSPVVSIIAVPNDKDYKGVYQALGAVSQSVILTDTERNPSLHWLPQDEALTAAQAYNPDVLYIKPLADAVEEAKKRVGQNGTILIVGTQSIVADTTMLWDKSYEVI